MKTALRDVDTRFGVPLSKALPERNPTMSRLTLAALGLLLCLLPSASFGWWPMCYNTQTGQWYPYHPQPGWQANSRAYANGAYNRAYAYNHSRVYSPSTDSYSVPENVPLSQALPGINTYVGPGMYLHEDWPYPGYRQWQRGENWGGVDSGLAYPYYGAQRYTRAPVMSFYGN